VTISEPRPSQQEVRSYPFGPPDRMEFNPLYAYLQEHEPLSRVHLPYGDDAWLVVRHEDVRAVLADPRFSRAATLTRDPPRMSPDQPSFHILDMDPPEHSRLRRLVAKAFTARRVEQLRPKAQQMADDLLDSMVEAGPPADLVASFGLPFPLAVTSELLGVTVADRGEFGAWSEAFTSATKLSPEQRRDYFGKMWAYMATMVEQRRQTPTDDLLGALVVARDEQDRLSEQELVELTVGLLAAGFETTTNQIGNFVYVLLHHPDQLALLRDRPELLPDAVEELMRFVPLTAGAPLPRYATEDVQLSGGVVPAGDPVLANRSAASRDPRAFANPDQLDLNRSPNPHVGFGYGAHHCLGAQLARMELQIALGSLLTRFPKLRFGADETTLQWKAGLALRGLRSLPVVW
jgi:cytochrome P450